VYTLAYKVSDSSGNTVDAVRTIRVVDKSGPQIIGVTDVTINVNQEFDPYEGVTAIDNVDGDVTSEIVVIGLVDADKPGEYQLVYRVSDAAGNITEVTRIITVVDNVKPVITGAEDMFINIGDSFDGRAGVKATDNIDGDITDKVVILGTVDITKAG